MSLKLFKQYIDICKELGVNPTLEGASKFKKYLGGKFMSIQQMLEESINRFGPNDMVTVLLSQKRDEEIVELQNQRYKEWIIKNRGKSYGKK